jgi:hypothetical protein
LIGFHLPACERHGLKQPAGMQPGDVILPDGRKINMRTMAPPK